MKVAIVFSAVFPYRTPVFNLLGDDYAVIYEMKREPQRTWDSGNLKHNAIFLKERYIRLGWEKTMHFNFDIFGALGKVDPDVVVLYGFGLTQQLAFIWARLHHRQTVVWTDVWSHTERNKSLRQVSIAKFMVGHSSAYIASGIKSRDYLVSLGAEPDRVYISRIVRAR